MASNKKGGSFLTGLLLGGFLGAILGILTAPKAGSDTRAQIAELSDVWRDRAEEMAAKMQEGVGPVVESVQDVVGPTTQGIKERVEPALDSVRERSAHISEARILGGSYIETSSRDSSNEVKSTEEIS